MINWSKIETVLLDMDGTLLDLRFDNHFWLFIMPSHYAEKNGMSLMEAIDYLTPIFKAQEGQLNWYCLDYWSHVLSINIAELKRQAKQRIQVLPHTRDFLMAIQSSGIRCVLVTNAHSDSLTLKLQETGLVEFFDAIVCAHDVGYPKEHPLFWTGLQQLERFSLDKTLFVDDSLSVLRSAEEFGLTHLVAVTCPDSSEKPRIVTDFYGVENLGNLLPIR
ncbi:MAG: HAD family hydrolase [Piscirickettsiaceae bacterium]|nr:MAG: HAD family hydrolase [Piscirickettsiaceae bacterium]